VYRLVQVWKKRKLLFEYKQLRTEQNLRQASKKVKKYILLQILMKEKVC